jgi:hypothetical protein
MIIRDQRSMQWIKFRKDGFEGGVGFHNGDRKGKGDALPLQKINISALQYNATSQGAHVQSGPYYQKIHLPSCNELLLHRLQFLL